MSTVSNPRTVEQVKASQGNQAFKIIQCKEKPGMAFFACGAVQGYVAKKLVEKLAAKANTETLIVSDVTTDDGKVIPTLHEENTANAIAVF